MKKILIAVTLMIALISTACQTTTLTQTAQPENTRVKLEVAEVSTLVDPELIKGSTVLIVVENIQKTGVTLGYDIGTLVQYQGQNYLVTHNHWGEMLQDMNIIELRDANYKMIRTMYAQEFKSLIVYQDAGTLVLHAPDRLTDSLTLGSLEVAPQLKTGDRVQVAHWSHPNRDHMEVAEAVVEETSSLKGEPVYTLRKLDGQPLHPGDSGGGVWYNGKLVANTWTVVTKVATVDTAGTVDPTSEELTEFSHAAIFPEEFK